MCVKCLLGVTTKTVEKYERLFMNETASLLVCIIPGWTDAVFYIR